MIQIDPMSQKEVANALGVSPSMIYLIEERAIKKMRKAAQHLGYSAEELLGALGSKNQINNTATKIGERE